MSRLARIVMVSAVAVVAAFALVTVVPAQKAFAASCHATSCTGLSAAATGCTADAKQIYKVSAPYDDGYVQLYYSPTCRSAWARVVSAAFDPGVYGYIYQLEGQTEQCGGIYVSSSNTYGCNTLMVDDAGTKSYAVGDFAGDPNPVATGTY